MRSVLLLYVTAVMACIAGQAPPATDSLYAGFQDPPRTYTIRPFWFWNGKLEQIKLNGLLGPVRIVPYTDTVIECRREIR